ncbi:MAG: AmmeMemoRadiSam system protein B [Phycisphaerales bacterium]
MTNPPQRNLASVEPEHEGTPPAFDPAAPHHQRPRLRPVRAFPAQMGDQVYLGLADARQISDRMIAAPMAVQPLLPLMDGQRSVDEIVAEFGKGLTAQALQGLVAQLDDAGLLFGPRFDALFAKLKEQFDSTPVLPPAATAAFADALVVHKFGEGATEEQKSAEGPGLLRESMDQWIAKALEDSQGPVLESLPRAIIAPHIDYQRGWLNYASVWGRVRGLSRPDRVVILGTNHFGLGTGVVACDKGFQSPLGVSPVDMGLVAAIRKRLGPEPAARLFENRYDHEREHSIELQIAWAQHCLGADSAGNFCPVVGVLVHDPSVNNGESYDGAGLGIGAFVEALRGALQDVGGRTLVVSSADLSHAGPMFGDPQTLAGETQEAQQARSRVMAHDNDMLNLIAQGKADELVAAMAWQQNPTRWCSTGNLVAAIKTVQPERVELIRYVASIDQQGMGMVTSVAGVMR